MAAFPRRFPRRGEVYMVDFNPARGSEQAGTRPALVVSNDVNNEHGRVVTVVALTTTIPEKPYPFTVHLPAGVLPREGTVLCNQIMTIDKQRLMRYRAALEPEQIKAVDEA